MRGDIRLAGSRWAIGPASFSDPFAVLETSEVEAVGEVMAQAETAARQGHWVVGFVSYQAAPGLDEKLDVPGVARLPLVWFGVYRQKGHGRPECERSYLVDEWTAGMTEETHGAKLKTVRQAIADGDTYQVNLTFPMTAEFEGSPDGLFAAMFAAQPDSYAALIDIGAAQILSVSPELFLHKQGTKVKARPMKGTAARGRFSHEDRLQARHLVASPKERAGNLMIVDLIRNDLGRVAEHGSVKFERLCEPERHPTVWQLTSTITATLRTDIGIIELFGATFPCGSVTGAPKVSTMRLIAKQEDVSRDIYCGAIGYLEPGGHNAEFSVAIRTGVISEGRFAYHVGGGITYDSDAAAEYEECLAKAHVVTKTSKAPGLVETMRYQPGTGIQLLDRHLARLSSSADYWGIDCDTDAIRDTLSTVWSRRLAKVRVVLSTKGDFEITVEPLVDSSQPVQLTVSPERVDPSDPHWFHKTTDRGRYPVTRAGSEKVLVNLDGEITETNISNLMVRLDDKWYTPPLASGCLPGVYRAEVVEQGRTAERTLTLNDLQAANELAVTNAVRGWREAVLVD